MFPKFGNRSRQGVIIILLLKLSLKRLHGMGGFHRASTGKNKKVIEISPLLAFWPERAKE